VTQKVTTTTKKQKTVTRKKKAFMCGTYIIILNWLVDIIDFPLCSAATTTIIIIVKQQRNNYTAGWHNNA